MCSIVSIVGILLDTGLQKRTLALNDSVGMLKRESRTLFHFVLQRYAWESQPQI